MAELNKDGFELHRSACSVATLDAIVAVLGGDGAAAGQRNLLDRRDVVDLLTSANIANLVRHRMTGPPRAVRAILFNKTAAANWHVAWHQDLAIAVREQREADGFGPWSTKQGVVHVQPPTELLERMLTVRIHLDAVDETNGALRVLPGTHGRGRLDVAEIEQLRREIPAVCCTAAAGDALLMRPLLLHASSKATTPRRRRVLHIEYADFDLPAGLAWRWSA